MTIARYCGGLFLALSLAAMGTAIGCTEAAVDSEAAGDDAVGEEELALTGSAASAASRGGRSDDCDERGRRRCRVWEATADIDEDARFAFIKVNNDCDIRRVEVDGEEMDCNHHGPRCDYEGFERVDCIVDLNNHDLRSGRRYDKDVEIEVRLADCDRRERPDVDIVVLERGGRFEKVDDVDVECRRRDPR